MDGKDPHLCRGWNRHGNIGRSPPDADIRAGAYRSPFRHYLTGGLYPEKIHRQGQKTVYFMRLGDREWKPEHEMDSFCNMTVF